MTKEEIKKYEIIFYWLNNTKGFIEDFELKTLVILYLNKDIQKYNITKINEAIESGDFNIFIKLLKGE